MTARFRHGLVIGKFYPPHAGHDRLVEVAASRCDRVTVVVAGASHETLSVAERVEWMRATHAADPRVRIVGDLDDHPVDYDDDEAWRVHTAFFAAAVARAAIEDGLAGSGAVVDAVFSGEPYGVELAGRLGAAHVDVDRSLLGVSGTAVRADVAGRWDSLSRSVRAGLALRVVVLGAESTGTTTLASDLAAAVSARGGALAQTPWVPEYGRQYTLDKLEAARWQAKAAEADAPDMVDLVWTPGDFVTIADRQRADEDLAASASPVLVCDTDAFATGVWLRRYLGTDPSPWADEVETIADSRRHHVYLLTDHHGVEFEQDGIRDGEAIRADMTGWFVEALERTGRPWVLMTGSREERLAAAEAEVDRLLAGGWEALR